MSERKIDAPAAELVVRGSAESHYGSKLKSITFTKVWYSSAGTKEFWDVEGLVAIKKGIFSKERRSLRYQVDPQNGEVIGYQDILIK